MGEKEYLDYEGLGVFKEHIDEQTNKLVPSASHYQSGTFTREISDAEWTAGYATSIEIPITTPFADAQNLVATLESNMQGLVCQLVGVSSQYITMDCYFNPSGGNALVQTDGIFVSWRVCKLMTDESRALDEAAINQNAQDIADMQDEMLTSSTTILAWASAATTTKSALIPTSNQPSDAVTGWGEHIVTVYGSGVRKIVTAMDYSIATQTIYTRKLYNGAWTTNWTKTTATADGLTSSVTSGSSAPVTSGGVYNYSYKRKMVQWNGAGNRYTKLTGLWPTTAGLMSTAYILTCRNGETWLMYCGGSDGDNKIAPKFQRLVEGTGKLFYFAWDSSTGEVCIGTQGYNGLQVTQVAGQPMDFTIDAFTSTVPISNPTELTYSTLGLKADTYVDHGINGAAVVIETNLATTNQNENFVVTYSSGSNSGNVVTVTGVHLLMIRHTKCSESYMQEEAFDCSNGKLLAVRAKNWWSSSWTAWTKV